MVMVAGGLYSYFKEKHCWRVKVTVCCNQSHLNQDRVITLTREYWDQNFEVTSRPKPMQDNSSSDLKDPHLHRNTYRISAIYTTCGYRNVRGEFSFVFYKQPSTNIHELQRHPLLRPSKSNNSETRPSVSETKL